MKSPLNQLSLGFLIAFGLVAGALGYWTVVARADVLARQDNPRNVLAEQQIQRGRIFARDDQVLAYTQFNKDGIAVRVYPHIEAASVVGYSSLRYGVGGIEAESDEILRGTAFVDPTETFINQILHRPLAGGDVRLTLDLAVQEAAYAALGDSSGAIVALDAHTGDVLALVSLPSFDPNTLDENWDVLTADPASPLLNRATQGLYQPGTAFLPITLGEALNLDVDLASATGQGSSITRVDTVGFGCAQQPTRNVVSLDDAFMWGCPGPFQRLGISLGRENIGSSIDDFGLVETDFDLPVERFEVEDSTRFDAGLTAIGQGRITVTPWHMALVASAFANRGQMPAPHLISATRAPGGDWHDGPSNGNLRGTISPSSAVAVAELMKLAVESGAAQAADQPGYDISGFCGTALSGPEHAVDTWFIGFILLTDGHTIAVAILLDNQNDCEKASHIGGEILWAAASTQQ
jgi:penicillin-binding protein A